MADASPQQTSEVDPIQSDEIVAAASLIGEDAGASASMSLPFGIELRSRTSDGDWFLQMPGSTSSQVYTDATSRGTFSIVGSPSVDLALPCSCSFAESTFSRRLQRRSLEAAYHMFVNPADPQALFRKFRLVKCMARRDKMAPVFQSLLCRSAYEALELFGLPYYCIGGAGKHSRMDSVGQTWYPQNVRLPKGILGLGDRVVQHSASLYGERLAALGYGGKWLDAFEVGEYLKEKGFHPQAYSSCIDNFNVDCFVDCEFAFTVLSVCEHC